MLYLNSGSYDGSYKVYEISDEEDYGLFMREDK